MSLESWLRVRRTVKAMGLVLEHSIMTTMTVELLGKCIQDAITEREENAEEFQVARAEGT